MLSSTRLLILGAIRFMQPVHGYDVRRELLSWRLEDLTNVKPGSIYGAIGTLAREGCLAVHSRASENSRPERTTYVLTREGEKEFQAMLREAWWTVRRGADPLVPALSMMIFLPREELARALRARVTHLEASLERTAFARATIPDGGTGLHGEIPEHVREILDFASARDRAEIEWAKTLSRRLSEGAYHFVGEEGFPAPEVDAGVVSVPSHTERPAPPPLRPPDPALPPATEEQPKQIH